MILLDNIVFQLQKVGGISKYWAKLIDNIQTHSNVDVHCLERQRSPANNIFRKDLVIKNLVNQDKWAKSFRFSELDVKCDVFHSSYYRTNKSSNRNIVTIHDFMNERFGTSVRDRALAAIKSRSIRKADIVHTVSESVRMELLDRFPQVAKERVVYIPNGVDQEFFPNPQSVDFLVSGRMVQPKSYFLYVGTKGVCKNFGLVLELVKHALDKSVIQNFIYVGQTRISSEELNNAGFSSYDLNKIYHMSGVTNDDLRLLYSNATALLIPSLYEGFGIPALEAARCQCIVISSSGGALEEIIGPSPYTFNLGRERHGEIERIIDLGYFSDSAIRERQRVFDRSCRFDWEKSASSMVDLYLRKI